MKNGKGIFAELGIDIYELYWKYYPKNTDTEKTDKKIMVKEKQKDVLKDTSKTDVNVKP